MKANHVEKAEYIALSSIFTPTGGYLYAGDSAESLRPLLDSIREEGVLRPIELVKREEGGYYLIDGFRRCCAAYLAHIEAVPAHIRDLPLQKINESRLYPNLTSRQGVDVKIPAPQPPKAHNLVALIKKFLCKDPK